MTARAADYAEIKQPTTTAEIEAARGRLSAALASSELRYLDDGTLRLAMRGLDALAREPLHTKARQDAEQRELAALADLDEATVRIAALEAARDAGYVPVLVSREAVEALRAAHKEHTKPFAPLKAHYLNRELYLLLERDLAAVLAADAGPASGEAAVCVVDRFALCTCGHRRDHHADWTRNASCQACECKTFVPARGEPK